MFNFECAESVATMTPLPMALCPSVDAGFWETVVMMLVFYWPVIALMIPVVAIPAIAVFKRKREIESLNLRDDQTIKERQ